MDGDERERRKSRVEEKKNGQKATPEGVGEKKNGDEPEWKRSRMARKAREDR